MTSFSLALVGCGKMGSALLAGYLDNPRISKITVVEPHELPPEISSHNKIFHIKTVSELSNTDIVLLAVKPQVMDAICEGLKAKLGEKTLIVSIAAGKTLPYFANIFGPNRPIIRVMPNTPAAIGAGISVAVPNQSVSDMDKHAAAALFAATGKLEWIKDESLMNAVTATSGSGPAYVFLLMETLAKAAEKQGLPSDFAMRLARQTVIGSAALAANEEKTSAEILRKNVTSPGGTTEAALEILMKGEMQKLFDDAIAAATKRGAELNS